MKKLSLISGALATAVSGALSGCVTERNRFDLEVSQQICNVDALAKEKDTVLATTNKHRLSLASYQNKLGDYDEKTSTILMQKLNTYDAEIEASYRFATQQCGAYMRCLERNKNDEGLCRRSEARWDESQRRFTALALDLREINAQIEMARIDAQSRRHRHHRRYDRAERCCGTVNSIFTDCCG